VLFSVKKYLDGEWLEARDVLTVVDRCVGKRMRKFCPPDMDPSEMNEGLVGDGPSRTLLEYMGRRNFKPPGDWDPSKGRALISK